MSKTPQISGGGVLGQKVEGPRRQLDTFEAPKHSLRTKYSSDEVTSNCPITGQPDWYKVDIEVQGAKTLIESKSLKLYLQSFKDDGQFCEAFATTILEDVWKALEAPAGVSVTVTQKPRGGVSIVAEAARGVVRL